MRNSSRFYRKVAQTNCVHNVHNENSTNSRTIIIRYFHKIRNKLFYLPTFKFKEFAPVKLVHVNTNMVNTSIEHNNFVNGHLFNYEFPFLELV